MAAPYVIIDEGVCMDEERILSMLLPELSPTSASASTATNENSEEENEEESDRQEGSPVSSDDSDMDSCVSLDENDAVESHAEWPYTDPVPLDLWIDLYPNFFDYLRHFTPLTRDQLAAQAEKLAESTAFICGRTVALVIQPSPSLVILKRNYTRYEYSNKTNTERLVMARRDALWMYAGRRALTRFICDGVCPGGRILYADHDTMSAIPAAMFFVNLTEGLYDA